MGLLTEHVCLSIFFTERAVFIEKIRGKTNLNAILAERACTILHAKHTRATMDGLSPHAALRT